MAMKPKLGIDYEAKKSTNQHCKSIVSHQKIRNVYKTSENS